MTTPRFIEYTDFPVVINRVKAYTDYRAGESRTTVRMVPATDNAEYPLLASSSSNASASFVGDAKFVTSGLSVNPSTKTITATKFVGALQGNADTATKLATAAALAVDLTSTTAISFDGSAAATNIPISGTLPVSHGGTGVTAIADIQAGKDASGNVITTTYAPLASPALTGTPTAPTAAAGTNTTQIATTAFVTSAVSAAVTELEAALGDEGTDFAALFNSTVDGTNNNSGSGSGSEEPAEP
jgi:hypothetical protein